MFEPRMMTNSHQDMCGKRRFARQMPARNSVRQIDDQTMPFSTAACGLALGGGRALSRKRQKPYRLYAGAVHPLPSANSLPVLPSLAVLRRLRCPRCGDVVEGKEGEPLPSRETLWLAQPDHGPWKS